MQCGGGDSLRWSDMRAFLAPEAGEPAKETT